MADTANFWAAPFRWIASILTGRALVALIDMDGEVNARLVRRNVLGEPIASRFGFGIHTVRLGRGGVVHGGVYVESWTLLRGKVFA